MKEYENVNTKNAATYPDNATTTKGISLGISKEELIKKIGKPAAVNGDRNIYRAEYHKGILKKYNLLAHLENHVNLHTS